LLSDVNMPGMSGLDLLRNVKTMSPDPPFILVSGLCGLTMAQGGSREGATDYLLKPVHPDDLIGLVSKHLNYVY
jgi:YesN/AraC family two-component response regulator